MNISKITIPVPFSTLALLTAVIITIPLQTACNPSAQQPNKTTSTATTPNNANAQQKETLAKSPSQMVNKAAIPILSTSSVSPNNLQTELAELKAKNKILEKKINETSTRMQTMPHQIKQFSEVIDKVLDNMPSLNGYSFDLATDLYENKDTIVVKIHVPGIDANNIRVKVEGTRLHIAGLREKRRDAKDEHYYHREIRCGDFERILELPYKISQKNIIAELKDGILTIILPKEEKREAQQVMIIKK